MTKLLISQIFAIFASIIIIGCRTADLPPGFSRVGGVLQNHTSQAASPAAVYSLMEWYIEANAELEVPALWNEYVQENRKSALSALHAQWQNVLVNSSGTLLKADPEHFIVIDPSVLASRTNFDSMDMQMRTIRTLLNSPNVIDVPINECINDAFWNPKTKYGKGDFIFWAKDRKLTVPAPASFHAESLLAQLQAIQNTLVAKKAIIQKLNHATALKQQGHFIEALDALSACLADIRSSHISLEAIQDSHTIPLLEDSIASIPFECIKNILDSTAKPLAEIGTATARPFSDANPLFTADSRLAALENTLSAQLAPCFQDERFEAARNKFAQQLRDTIRKIADGRLAAWKFSQSSLFEQKNYWDAAQDFQQHIAALRQDASSQFVCYTFFTSADGNNTKTIADSLEEALREHFRTYLPETIAALTDMAQKALKLQQRPGFAFAIGKMAKDIIEMAENTDEKLLAPIENITGEALAVIEKNVLTRTISIADMSSSVPGLGITYTRDLKLELQDILKSFGLDNHAIISQGSNLDSPYSYVLFDGYLADFDATGTTERNTTRTVLRFGEIKVSPNPEAVADPQKPPKIYTQEVIKQVINIREIERIAHIRVCVNLRGPGFTTPVEINEFYNRTFVIETSHPINDVLVQDIVRTSDLSKLPVQDAEPVLHADRVCTPGELLDMARKDSLRVFSLKLLFHINQFPIMLAGKARHFSDNKDLTQTIEFWACCDAICSQLHLENDTTAALFEKTRPQAKCYEECITALRQQRVELMKLQKDAPEAMRKAANEGLKQAIANIVK